MVLLYAALGALAGWLGQRLVRARRASDRGERFSGRGLPATLAGLVVVLAAAVVPALVGDRGADASEEARELAEFRAGFLDACARGQERAVCACVWEKLVAQPTADTVPELAAIQHERQRTGRLAAEVRRAIDACPDR